MKNIFPHSFYWLFPLPNKKEVFETLTDSKYIDEEVSSKITWNRGCNVKVDQLHKDKVKHVLIPSIEIFSQRIVAKKSISLIEIWKNTYDRGGFQEVHDHLCQGVHISGCIFLEDQTKDTSKFYFFNRHNVELTVWKESVNHNGTLSNKWYPNIKAGDILLFPSHVLHGVSPHNLSKTRTTISFNLRFD